MGAACCGQRHRVLRMPGEQPWSGGSSRMIGQAAARGGAARRLLGRHVWAPGSVCSWPPACAVPQLVLPPVCSLQLLLATSLADAHRCRSSSIQTSSTSPFATRSTWSRCGDGRRSWYEAEAATAHCWCRWEFSGTGRSWPCGAGSLQRRRWCVVGTLRAPTRDLHPTLPHLSRRPCRA